MDHEAIWAALSATDLRWFSVSVLLGWVLLAYKGLRWQILLAHWHIRLRPRRQSRSTCLAVRRAPSPPARAATC